MSNLVRLLREAPDDVEAMLVTHLPGRLGDRLRYRYWKRRLGHLGRGVRIDVGAWFQHPEQVYVGDHAWIDRNVLVLAGLPREGRRTARRENAAYRGRRGEVHIGSRTHVAPFCVLSGMGGLWIGDDSGVASHTCIYTLSHHYRNLEDRTDRRQYTFSPMVAVEDQAMVEGPVVLEDHTGVGTHCTLLPGAHLVRGAFLGSHAVFGGRAGAQTVVTARHELEERELSLVLP